LKPHLIQHWCIPPKQDAEYVARMEEILDLYVVPHDPCAPLVCMDEQPVQLVKEKRIPIAMGAGRPRRVDYEYERNGTACLFMFVEPKGGWRRLGVRQRRTKVDWAWEIRELLQMHYPHADTVRVVLDNLNTHTIASLYEAFPPEEARRLASRLEIHYTPKHASWLNIAETELSVFTRQCLCDRIPDIDALRAAGACWERDRNAEHKCIDWTFTTEDARERLPQLYPQVGADSCTAEPNDPAMARARAA
jgi:hypothetical protein